MAAGGVSCLFLKGLLFAERYYGDPERRHQKDLDVLVPDAQLERSLEILGGCGFDVTVDLESDTPMDARLRRIRHPGRRRVPHAVSIGRDGITLDLHWCLRSRGLSSRDEAAIWPAKVRSLP